MSNHRNLRSSSNPDVNATASISENTFNDALKKFSETTFHDALLKLRSDIRSDFQSEIQTLTLRIDSLQTTIQEQAHEIDLLKSITKAQTYSLEQIERKNRSKQAIIVGLPEENDENLDAKIKALISKTGNDTCHPTRGPHRIGKKSAKARPICVYFISEIAKRTAIEKFRKLQDDSVKGIYMNYDETQISRQENARLRTKKKALVTANPGKQVRIHKGKLYLDDNLVDQFDVANQVF